LIKNAMINTSENVKGFLIDGFPRQLDQAHQFETVVASPTCALFFHCPLDILEKRLLKRGETSGRSDDNMESIKKRFATFTDQSMPVVDYYTKSRHLVTINSTYLVETVYAIARATLLSRIPTWSPPPGVDLNGRPLIFVLGNFPNLTISTICLNLYLG
jgi:adenylate kinase family enzyme